MPVINLADIRAERYVSSVATAVLADLADSVEEFDKAVLASHMEEIQSRIEKTEPGSALDKLVTRLDDFKEVDRHLTGTAMH